MGEQKCNLIFTGQIAEGKTRDEVHNKLAAIFKTDIENIRKMFGTGPSVIKKNADTTMAEKMLAVLTQAGAICDIEPLRTPPADSLQEETVKAETPAESMPEPSDTPMAEPPSDPYAAPQADLSTPSQSNTIGFTGPKKVPASHGAAWVARGVDLVKKNPLNWFLSMLLYGLVNSVQIIPLLGPLVLGLLGPTFLAGYMQGIKELDEGERLDPTCMFYGFKKNFGQLVLFAFLFFLCVFLIIGVSIGIVAAVFGLNMTMFSDPGSMAGSSILMFALIPLIILLLIIPITMCYWFAPALIYINDMSNMDAVKLSFEGCLKNWLAFLVNGLVLLGLFMGVCIVIGIVGIGMQSVFGETGAGIAIFLIVMPLMFIMMPLMFSIMYSSYKDIFYD